MREYIEGQQTATRFKVSPLIFKKNFVRVKRVRDFSDKHHRDVRTNPIPLLCVSAPREMATKTVKILKRILFNNGWGSKDYLG